jgi:hypothetical protein
MNGMEHMGRVIRDGLPKIDLLEAIFGKGSFEAEAGLEPKDLQWYL